MLWWWGIGTMQGQAGDGGEAWGRELWSGAEGLASRFQCVHPSKTRNHFVEHLCSNLRTWMF